MIDIPQTQLSLLFEPLDSLPKEAGYLGAIDAAGLAISVVDDWARKLAEVPTSDEELVNPKPNKYVRLLGALAQMWEAPEYPMLPQKPSSLGQILVLGGLGAAGGHYAGKLIDKVLPNDYVKASRAGTALGALLGATPGLASAYLNPATGKARWTESFWSTAKESNFPNLPPSGLYPINVQEFHNYMWNDARIRDFVPMHLRAAASGLVQGASNLPGKNRNSPFVTPFDVARMAVGMGSGAASGWLVGRTLGALFGTSRKTQDLLMNAGMAAGAMKTVVPLAFGADIYDT